MSNAPVSESTVEAVALDWLGSLDWAIVHGPGYRTGHAGR